jgi:hypothetical protein
MFANILAEAGDLLRALEADGKLSRCEVTKRQRQHQAGSHVFKKMCGAVSVPV